MFNTSGSLMFGKDSLFMYTYKHSSIHSYLYCRLIHIPASMTTVSLAIQNLIPFWRVMELESSLWPALRGISVFITPPKMGKV